MRNEVFPDFHSVTSPKIDALKAQGWVFEQVNLGYDVGYYIIRAKRGDFVIEEKRAYRPDAFAACVERIKQLN